MHTQAVDLTQNDSRGVRRYAWIMWLVAAIFYAYEFSLKLSMTVMMPELMRDFSVGGQALGFLSSLYFFAYAGMQIPVGIAMDRFGARRLLSFAALVISAGALTFGWADALYIAGIGRFLMGFGSAFAFVGCLKISAMWFSPRQFSTIVGLTNMLGVFGVLAGETPLSLMVDNIGWRQSMVAAAVMGVGLAVLNFLVLRDRGKSTLHGVAVLPSGSEIWRGLKAVLRCSQTWLVALYACMMVAPVVGFAEQWSVPYIKEMYHDISRTEASALSLLVFVGIGVGGLCHGAVSSWLGQRRPVMSFGAVAAFFSLLGVLYLPIHAEFITGLLLFSFGFFTSSMLLAFALNAEINPSEVRGSVIGFTNMIVMAGGALFQPLIGKLLDVYWDKTVIAGARHFALHDFHIALGVLPVCQLLAMVILLFIRESGCREVEPSQGTPADV